MKLRSWLMLLLFVHVMLHPWVHAVGSAKPISSSASISDLSHSTDDTAGAIDHCELCRIGHNATLTVALPQTDLLNPRWIHVALQSINYASLQADVRLPSRAPPTC